LDWNFIFRVTAIQFGNGLAHFAHVGGSIIRVYLMIGIGKIISLTTIAGLDNGYQKH